MVESNSRRAARWVAAATAVLLLAHGWRRPDKRRADHRSSKPSATPNTPLETCDLAPRGVPDERPWTSSGAAHMRAAGRPVLFRRAANWTGWAAANWTGWDDLLAAVPAHVPVSVESNGAAPEFSYFDNSNDFGGGGGGLLGAEDWSSASVRRFAEAKAWGGHRYPEDMTWGAFVDALKTGGGTRVHRYVTRTVASGATDGDDDTDDGGLGNNDPAAGALAQHLAPAFPPAFLVVPEKPRFTGLLASAPEPVLNVWMGTSGVVTQAHYDEQHNMFVQLLGCKRFTLIPPCGIDALHLYPDLHVRARKAQVPLSRAPAVAHFPLHAHLPPEPIRVEVCRGDVLYIPAFWIHRVEVIGHGGALSANVFSRSESAALKAEAFGRPLPFDGAWLSRPEVAAAAAAEWLHLLVEGELGWSVQDVGARLVYGRYLHIGGGGGDDGGNQVGWCGHGRAAAVDALLAPARGRFAPAAKTLAGLFRRMPEAVRWQALLSYVELVAFHLLGQGALKPFVRSCMLDGASSSGQRPAII